MTTTHLSRLIVVLLGGAAAAALSACSSSTGEDASSSDSELAACTTSVTKNAYDGPSYWGTLAFKNGASASAGYAVSFDVASGAHCTNDSVPSGATLSPLVGSGSSAATASNHCVFTWHATLAAGASKTFNYSTDSNHSGAATHVVVTLAGCTNGGGSADAGAPPPHDAGGGAANGCDTPGLVWKTANKTNFTSYPAPGSVECIQYNGCAYEGEFAACSQTESKSWVSSHNIVSVFPNLTKGSGGIGALALHDLCLKSGSKSIVVTVLDECADSDCSGCCTENKGSADELIDIESYTDARFGVEDGPIQWADLGATKTSGCN